MRLLSETDNSKWFVSVPGTSHGKQRNKSLYGEAHFQNTVIEAVAENSKEPARKVQVKLPNGTIIERIEGISPVKPQTLRKAWRR